MGVIDNVVQESSKTKVATALAKGSAAEATTAIGNELKQQLGGAKPALVMAFSSTQQPLGEVMPILCETFGAATVLGSSTAGEFTAAGDAKGAIAAFALAGELRVHAGFGTQLRESPEHAVATALAGLPPRSAALPHRVGVILLDPLSGRGEEAALLAGEMLAKDGPVPLAGGAAGDDLAMRATEVALGRTVHSDALVIATIDLATPIGLGVFHGHEPISPPLRVTKAAGNVVYEVDGRDAWSVWSEHTRAAARRRGVDPESLRDDELGAFLLRYQAALPSSAGHRIRAPLSRSADGSLTFATAIPEGARIRITESDAERQLASAGRAAREAKAKLGDRPIAGALVFDCICRNLILGPRFADAVGAISRELGDVPLCGFETYGEVALDEDDLSGFHNTTTVVLAFSS